MALSVPEPAQGVLVDPSEGFAAFDESLHETFAKLVDHSLPTKLVLTLTWAHSATRLVFNMSGAISNLYTNGKMHLFTSPQGLNKG